MDRRPRHVCRLCGDRFHTPEQQARHVRRCFTRDEDTHRSRSLAAQAPDLFGDAGVDTEFIDWHERHGYRKVNQ
jgi:hypothetical protein